MNQNRPENRPEGWDWRAELGHHEGRAAQETFNDQLSVFRFIFWVLTLPVRIPLTIRRIILRRREMIRFARKISMDRLVSDELIAEVCLQWVESHSDRYPLGQYDPRLRRLQRTFESIIRRQQ